MELKEKYDRNMVDLIEALNAFSGIETFGSCGGHKNPTPAQWAEGTFYVKFNVAWNEDGRFSLEFLAWLVNSVCPHLEQLKGIQLLPYAPPPYLNTPGECLCFVIQGRGNPRKLAKEVKKAFSMCFISAKDLRQMELQESEGGAE